MRIGAAFIARHYPHSNVIYVPVPTWGNHIPIFKDSGLEVRGYRYFDKETVGLDFEGLKADLKVYVFNGRKSVRYLTVLIGSSRASYCFASCLCPQSDRYRSY